VQFDAVAVGIGQPRLPCLVQPQLGVGDFQPLGAKFGNGSCDIVNFQTDVAVALLLRARRERTLKHLDERACAGLQVDAVPFAAVASKFEGGPESQLSAVEIQRAIQIGDDKADVCKAKDHGAPLEMWKPQNSE